jgi:streptomycin 6-kinase
VNVIRHGKLAAVDDLDIPEYLAAAAREEDREDWLATLPRTVAELERRWELEVGAPFRPGGQTAWVAPATNARSDDLVVKVLWRHPEAEHEADGLRFWSGDGAVLLHADEVVDARTAALLLERCRPGGTLEALPEPEQDIVVARLLRRLWREPPVDHPFPSLESMCEQWAHQFEEKAVAREPPLDLGLVRDGIELFRELPANADRRVVLATDLHAGNVLSAEREPWLVIDPKPHLGDPTYDALQHMLNCEERLRADPLGLVARLADLLDLDGERLRLWLFARCAQESAGWPGLAEVARLVAPAS